jgi:hypothetical protein
MAEQPPTRVAGRWYRGDCHVHSVHSDGQLTPRQLTVAARAAGLDFLAATEHNTAAPHAWSRHAATEPTDTRPAGHDPLVILGEEVTTRRGHWLAVGLRPGEVIDPRECETGQAPRDALRHVHDQGGLAVAAHPHAPYDTGTFQYPYDGFDAVEVWNGPWTSELPWQADNEAALAGWSRDLAADLPHGAWRPAVGNSDTHLPGQIGIAHTVVFAGRLHVAAILVGIRAGRCYIAASADIHVSFTAEAGERRAGIGDRLVSGGKPVVAWARVAGVPGGIVSFHTRHGLVHRARLPEAGSGAVAWRTTAAESGFVRVEIRRPEGGMAALTNPIPLR